MARRGQATPEASAAPTEAPFPGSAFLGGIAWDEPPEEVGYYPDLAEAWKRLCQDLALPTLAPLLRCRRQRAGALALAVAAVLLAVPLRAHPLGALVAAALAAVAGAGGYWSHAAVLAAQRRHAAATAAVRMLAVEVGDEGAAGVTVAAPGMRPQELAALQERLAPHESEGQLLVQLLDETVGAGETTVEHGAVLLRRVPVPPAPRPLGPAEIAALARGATALALTTIGRTRADHALRWQREARFGLTAGTPGAQLLALADAHVAHAEAVAMRMGVPYDEERQLLDRARELLTLACTRWSEGTKGSVLNHELTAVLQRVGTTGVDDAHLRRQVATSEQHKARMIERAHALAAAIGELALAIERMADASLIGGRQAAQAALATAHDRLAALVEHEPAAP